MKAALLAVIIAVMGAEAADPEVDVRFWIPPSSTLVDSVCMGMAKWPNASNAFYSSTIFAPCSMYNHSTVGIPPRASITFEPVAVGSAKSLSLYNHSECSNLDIVGGKCPHVPDGGWWVLPSGRASETLPTQAYQMDNRFYGTVLCPAGLPAEQMVDAGISVVQRADMKDPHLGGLAREAITAQTESMQSMFSYYKNQAEEDGSTSTNLVTKDAAVPCLGSFNSTDGKCEPVEFPIGIARSQFLAKPIGGQLDKTEFVTGGQHAIIRYRLRFAERHGEEGLLVNNKPVDEASTKLEDAEYLAFPISDFPGEGMAVKLPSTFAYAVFPSESGGAPAPQPARRAQARVIKEQEELYLDFIFPMEMMAVDRYFTWGVMLGLQKKYQFRDVDGVYLSHGAPARAAANSTDASSADASSSNDGCSCEKKSSGVSRTGASLMMVAAHCMMAIMAQMMS